MIKKKKLKKVAVILSSEPECGGEHQYLMLIAEALKRCDGKYLDLLAVCSSHFWSVWCRENNVNHLYTKLPNYNQEQLNKELRCITLSKIYHTFFSEFGCTMRRNCVELIIIGQQGISLPPYFIKQVGPIHDLMHRYEPDFAEIKSSCKAREILFSNKSKIMDMVFVDSDLGKKQFLESYCQGKMRKPRIEVLPFVVPPHISKTREEYIEVPEKYIFYPAQFWEHKNHIRLIHAVSFVREVYPDIMLVLAGSEKNNMNNVKKAIKDNGLENNVVILGFVSNEQITYLYKHAAALIMPSYFGPTNIPPLEAMALGCPVLVSNKYAMGEQVGEAGMLFNPDSTQEMAECIMKIWNDTELRNEMSRKGKMQVSKWTHKDFKKRFIKVILRELK